ncbi:MAG: nitrous oxide-stimulated promoter family protein [Clostridiales bacterium]|nr:nitrous oxide-stimulated promoter family protein [Clostridiales bacterium]
MNRIDREKKTIKLMIEIYCKHKHGNKDKKLCKECNELLEYAHKRLSFCKFGNEKSTCSRCPIHCYKSDMKLKIKEVMRYSGIRLLIYSPIELIRHALNK